MDYFIHRQVPLPVLSVSNIVFRCCRLHDAAQEDVHQGTCGHRTFLYATQKVSTGFLGSRAAIAAALLRHLDGLMEGAHVRP